MRPAPAVCLLVACAAIAAAPDRAVARPTVAITAIDIAGDSVGVDIEAVGIARELTQALRRAANRPDGPLQLVDPMVRADDVEALVWGKLLRDGDGWVVTVHLSAVGADGDTVSYRAVISQARTSSVELGKWGTIVYDSLLDQVELDKDDPTPAPATGTVPPAVAGGDMSGNPFTVRDPLRGPDDLLPGDEDPPRVAPVVIDPGPQFQRDHGVSPEPAPHASARRLFWISAAVAGAGAAFWTYSWFRVSDAEDQIERLAGCTGCDRAISAANAQGNRWEGMSWLAGTATVAGVAAAVLFGYQGYIVGRTPGPSELVGSRRAHGRGFRVTPALSPDRIGASVAVTF